MFAQVSLYVICLTAALSLAAAANTQGVLSKEEASSGFVNPLFLSWRLQHHVMGTNFYAYVYFLVVSHLGHGLFYVRIAKAALMACLPGFVYLYLRKGFGFAIRHAFGGALAVSLLPGFLAFSWLGVDFGMETAIGFGALWLALFDAPAAIVGSSVLAAMSAESYGSGIAFLVAVAVTHALRYAKLWLSAMLLTLVIPVFWWKNVQTLIVGGGGLQPHGAADRVTSLASELFVRGDSYYFFSGGLPALGSMFIGLLGLAGLCLLVVRKDRRILPLVLICATTMAVYSVAGNVPGVRRTIPLVIGLGLLGVLFLHALAQSRRAMVRGVAYAAFAVWMLIGCYGFYRLREGLASARIALPSDFEFRIAPGETMESTVTTFLDGSRQLPSGMEGYEPDRTLSILYMLGKRGPLYSPGQIVARCDRHGWSIPSASPRFARLRARVRSDAFR